MPTKSIAYYTLLLTIALFLFNIPVVRAQESIDMSYSFGSILVHASGIRPISSNPVNAFAFTYTTKNKVGEDWKKYYNQANSGFIYEYKNFNYPEVLGHAHSLSTFLQFSFLRRRNVFDIGFKGQAGIAYLNKIYNKELNPLNTAISTHFNVAAETQFYTKLRFHPIFIEYSFGLNHFSNGLIKAPNLGINTLNNHFSVGVEFEKPVVGYRIPKQDREPFPKNEFWLYTAIGTKEVKNYDGRFTFSTLSLNYSRQLSTINKTGIGLDFIDDEAATQYATQNLEYTGTEDLSFRFGPNIQTEFIFGRTSIFGAYGFYFGNNDYYSKRAYYKVGSKVHFANFFGTVIIQAVPLFKAQALVFGVGYRFRRNSQNQL